MACDCKDVSYGDKAPEVVNVIIEIQKGKGQNKYEMDKKTGGYLPASFATFEML